MRALHSLSRFIFYFVSHALSPLSCPFPVVSLQRCGASLPTCTPWPSGGVLSPNFDWAVCWLAGSGCTTGIGMFQVCVTHPHAAPSIACLSFDRVCVLLPSLLALQVPSDTCSTPRDVKALLGSPPYTIGGSNAVLDFTSACPPPPPPPPPAATGGDDGDGDAAQRLDRLGGGGGAGAIVGVIVGLLVVGGLGAGGYVAYKKGYLGKKGGGDAVQKV